MPRFLGIDSRLLTICSFVAIVLTVSLIISMAIPDSELTFPFVHAAVKRWVHFSRSSLPGIPSLPMRQITVKLTGYG